MATARRRSSSAGRYRPSVHSATARRCSTCPVIAPLDKAVARSRAASPAAVRPACTRARPRAAPASAWRSAEPVRRASRSAERSSRTPAWASPTSRNTMPAAWWATDAWYGSGRAASTARARASASCGRDKASGSRSSTCCRPDPVTGFPPSRSDIRYANSRGPLDILLGRAAARLTHAGSFCVHFVAKRPGLRRITRPPGRSVQMAQIRVLARSELVDLCGGHRGTTRRLAGRSGTLDRR